MSVSVISRASVKTASWLPARGTSVKTSHTTYRWRATRPDYRWPRDASPHRPPRRSCTGAARRAASADGRGREACTRARRTAAHERIRAGGSRHEPVPAGAADGHGSRIRRAQGRRPARARRGTGRLQRRCRRPRRLRRPRRPPAGLRPRGPPAHRRRSVVPARRIPRDRAVIAISVSGLRKSYGPLEAVRGVDFDVEEGEVFGLLGPNGAGKTTTVEILEGYRTRDGGDVSVLGNDPQRPTRDFRERIGVVLQQAQLWPTLSVRETHAVFAGYYERPRNVDDVIELVGLSEKRNARVNTLSGGQKRRLDLGIALVGDPDLVFLDEPTTGFDPAAPRAAWDMIRSLRSLGKTVLLTTHYLDEAEQLADRVAVLREGQIVRIGTPRELTAADLEVEIRYRRAGEEILLRTTEPTRVLHELTAEALARGEELERLEVRRPSLEEVYLALVSEDEPA